MKKSAPLGPAGTVWLYAPESYLQASPAVRAQVVNGCGPAGWKYKLISDSLWGLNIRVVCDIHDWMYSLGETIAAKDEADRCFMNNMDRMITAAGGPGWLVALRRRRAKTYDEAVHMFGGAAFWYGKNGSNVLFAVMIGAPANA